MEIVLATNNAKKLAELRRIVAELDLTVSGQSLDVVGLSEVADYPAPAETENSFEGNALLKARACAAETGRPALADDSGLEVDVLNRMPGVRSARWSGAGATDESNVALLLEQIEDVEAEQRTGRFVCAMAYVLPASLGGAEHTVRGEMPGTVGTAPVGEGGFGYDPIFVAEGYTVTTAELDAAAKDEISHRGKAVRRIVPLLVRALEASAPAPGEN